jgi:hypothetical protein
MEPVYDNSVRREKLKQALERWTSLEAKVRKLAHDLTWQPVDSVGFPIAIPGYSLRHP